MATEFEPATRKPRLPAWVLVFLLMPYCALCFPSLYARNTPVLLGFPFFYWYQFLWVLLTSALLYAVYLRMARK